MADTASKLSDYSPVDCNVMVRSMKQSTNKKSSKNSLLSSCETIWDDSEEVQHTLMYYTGIHAEVWKKTQTAPARDAQRGRTGKGRAQPSPSFPLSKSLPPLPTKLLVSKERARVQNEIFRRGVPGRLLSFVALLLALVSPGVLAAQELKRSFIGIELGQTIDEFRSQVSNREAEPTRQLDSTLPESYYYFLYDLYLSEIEEGGKQETLVEVKGNGYVDKGVFQFAASGGETKPRLVAITIFLNPRWSSYDQIFQKLTQDYGNPLQLNPQRSIWRNEQTVVSLEKQLRYKIIDKEYLDELRARNQEDYDIYRYNYEEFLKKF